MPFKSKAQHRAFRAMEARGELPEGTSHRWAEHTKSMKALPEHVSKDAAVAKDFAPLNDGGTAEKHPHMPVSTSEVHKGIPVEKEHTDSKTKARAIAVDHVVEIPDYYKRLEKLEREADEDGVKRADRLLRQIEALPDKHDAELAAATDEANKSLQRKQVISELAAGAGGMLSVVPGVGLLLPSYSELRDRARDSLEAQAAGHAEDLGALQQQHAEQATELVRRLRSRAKKTASFFLPQTDEELNNQQSGLRWGTLAGAVGGGLFNSGTLPGGESIAWQDYLPTLAGAKAGGQAGVITAGMHRAFTDPILTTESGGAVPASEGHMPGQGWRPLIGAIGGAGLGGWGGHELGTEWLMGMHDQAGSQFTGTAAGGTIGALGGAALGGLADKYRAQDILRSRGIKVAVDLTMTSPGMAAAPRGDELHLPMGSNPYMGDPKAVGEYENGYAYAQALGHQMLNQATEGDVQRWIGNEQPWRQGFADACSKFGLERVGQLVAPPEKSAAQKELSPEAHRDATAAASLLLTPLPKPKAKIAAAVPSALEPGGHWARGILATLGGVGGGVATHSLWGDPGELYTLVPPALAGVTAGTVLADTLHSATQLPRTPDVPITGTDDPRVRIRQGLAGLAGLAAGAGLGYLGGHELAPESWHQTSGGHVPEIVGTSVGGVAGAMGASALENRLSGRTTDSRYTSTTPRS